MIESPTEFAVAFSVGLCAFVFAVTGASKLVDVDAVLQAMSGLHVPQILRRRLVAVLVSAGELGLSLSLVLGTGWLRSVAAVFAAAALMMFTALLIGVLRRGEDVDCGCFGRLTASNKVTRWSVGRNLLLIAVALVVVIFGRDTPSLLSILASGVDIPNLALVLAWMSMGLVVLLRELGVARRSANAPHQQGTVDEHPHAVSTSDAPRVPLAPLSPASLAAGLDPARPGEPRMGDPIPLGELVTDRGVSQPLHELANGKPTLLVFLSAECGSCRAVAGSLAQWRRELAPIEVRVATSSMPDAITTQFADIAPIVRYGALGARRDFGVQRLPAAVALGGQHQPIVASPIAYGFEEIDALVRSLVGARVHA